jgi:capsid protein
MNFFSPIRASMTTVAKAALGGSKWLSNKFPRSGLCRKMYHGVRNWYEAGWPLWTNGNFSYLPALVQDSRWDQNFVTRREMLRRMRYWSQNSAIVESLLSIGERYTVGPAGLHVAFYPDEDFSADADNSWHDRAEQVIAEWFSNCGYNGETFEQLLKIGYRCQRIDGEIFYVKTHKALPLALGDRLLNVQKPCLQMVEAHRCESPWNKFEQEGDSLVDGVQFDNMVDTGLTRYRKVGYWMRSGLSSFEQHDSWELVDADDVWHIYNAHRVNQFRGLSDFYPVGILINKLEDVLEIEMKAQVTQSLRAVGITNNAGAANPLDKKFETLGGFGLKTTAVPTAPNEKEWKERGELYRKESGAYTYFLKSGEEVKFDSPNRPSQESIILFEFLINEICAGSKIPRSLVIQKISSISARAQGTELRAELDNGDLFFKSDFQKWKKFTKEAVVWFMEWAVKNDPRVADPPANWRNCIHIMQPGACNVDVGYSTQSDLMMLAAGVKDYESIIQPMGMSFMTVAKRLARQQKFLKAQGIEVTLPALLRGQIPINGQPKEETEAVHA